MGKQSRRKYEKRHAQPIVLQPTEPYSSATERASKDDRAWFEAHPGAVWRLRPYVAGEFRDQVPPCDHQVYVYQLKPGQRMRTSVSPAEAEVIEAGLMVVEPRVEDGAVAWLGALQELTKEAKNEQSR